MSEPQHHPGFLKRVFAPQRLRILIISAAALGTLVSFGWTGSLVDLYLRFVLVGGALLALFALVEQWPRRLPNWLARWAVQILIVAIAAPFATAIAYSLTTIGDPTPWVHEKDRMKGFGIIAGLTVLIAPWIAMIAVYRDISGRAARQALEFDLERSQFAQQTLQARMSLLQAQVEPHFLFNTLANIRELVQQGSPHAPEMLESLIGYLRAAVPRLHEVSSTIQQELELVTSYLQIMHMRMPDRLKTTIQSEPGASDVKCPPGSIIVLVENAVRHGIDPSELGGSILVDVRVDGDHCVVEVVDTGVGLGGATAGLGTGLENLQERLKLGYGPSAGVDMRPNFPVGTRARLRVPAWSSP